MQTMGEVPSFRIMVAVLCALALLAAAGALANGEVTASNVLVVVGDRAGDVEEN